MKILIYLFLLLQGTLPVHPQSFQQMLESMESSLKTESVSYMDNDLSNLEAMRQRLFTYSLHLEEGQKRLESKYNSVINQRENGWMAASAFFDGKRKSLQGQMRLLDQCDKLFQALQESLAKDKPDSDTPPADVFEYMTIQTTSFAQGAPGGGPGFTRACPAADENPNGASSILGIEGIEGVGNQLNGSSGLMMPAKGYVSAGTWTYPNGGLHLGMDLALSMFTPIYAPADGIILYAANPVGDAGGYLGNWAGWPYGGGNTIAMICKSSGQLYGVTFCHLSSRIMVRAGQQVSQGDLIAYSGNTGNSTGPHTHIELFPLKVTLDQAMAYFRQGADFSFGTGWSTPATCSPYACRVRPEQYFGQ